MSEADHPWYVLWDPVKRQYIGIDHGSGGYPFYTKNPNDIRFFISEDAAMDYAIKVGYDQCEVVSWDF